MCVEVWELLGSGEKFPEHVQVFNYFYNTVTSDGYGSGLWAIHVLRNAFFWKFDTHPLVTLITLNREPS